MLVKLLWNLGTLILLVNVFHEKPKSKYFFFYMRGCGRGSREKAVVAHFVVAVAFLCPKVLGGVGFVLFCFICNSPVECFASSFTRTEVTFSLFIYLYKSCGGV